MNSPHAAFDIIPLLVNFGVQGTVAWFVWRYYRARTFPGNEKYSTFAPRFWAPTVDALVLLPTSIINGLPAMLGAPAAIGASMIIVQNVIWLTYTIWMHAARGQTVGKIVCRVKVVDNATEGALSVRQAMLRESIPLLVNMGFIIYDIRLVSSGILAGRPSGQPPSLDFSSFWFVGAFPLLWFIAEVITMFTNAKRRALHDFIAGTCVIRTNIDLNYTRDEKPVFSGGQPYDY